MREMVGIGIDDMLRKEQGEFSVTKDLNANFFKFIVDHYLRKFYGFHLLNPFNHFLHLNLAHPGEPQASGDRAGGERKTNYYLHSKFYGFHLLDVPNQCLHLNLVGHPEPEESRTSGDQAGGKRRKPEVTSSWHKKLMPKFRRGQRDDSDEAWILLGVE